MALTLGLSAQEAPKVTSAIIALRGNELVEAKGFIDEATDIIAGKNQAEIKEKILSNDATMWISSGCYKYMCCIFNERL